MFVVKCTLGQVYLHPLKQASILRRAAIVARILIDYVIIIDIGDGRPFVSLVTSLR